jgi:hypothetical protein
MHTLATVYIDDIRPTDETLTQRDTRQTSDELQSAQTHSNHRHFRLVCLESAAAVM